MLRMLRRLAGERANRMKDDYISREAVLEHYRVTDPAGTFAYCNSILDFVSNLPAADVKPAVRGKWIDDGSGCVVCSECGEEHEWDSFRANFCDNCGARMED